MATSAERQKTYRERLKAKGCTPFEPAKLLAEPEVQRGYAIEHAEEHISAMERLLEAGYTAMPQTIKPASYRALWAELKGLRAVLGA